jgi:FemAB family protein
LGIIEIMTSIMSIETIRTSLAGWIRESGLSALPRIDAPAAWQDAWAKCAVQAVNATTAMIDYQHAYLSGHGNNLIDISLVLLNNGNPVALWPLTLTLGINQHLSSMGAAIQAPCFVADLSPRTIKKITAAALRFVQAFQKRNAQQQVISEEYKTPNSTDTGLTEWHQQWMAAGATTSVRHDLYIDLSLSVEQIRASFRKSYRPLISSGLKLWNVEHLTQENIKESVWAEFKSLHLQVSGRVTRNDQTWALQYQMVLDGEAMLIVLRDAANGHRMIGAGFFQMTRDEGVYAVAAYDRELFDMPVGHVVQMRAIEIMKQQGLRWYRIGERFFPSDTPQPNEKELAISLFKQGFATHLLPRFILNLPLQTSVPSGSAVSE